MHLTITVLFGLLCAWLGWRLFRLKQGANNLSAILRSDSNPEVSRIRKIAPDQSLRNLSEAIADSVFESSLAGGQKLFMEVVLNEIQDGILIVDTDESVLFANRASQSLFESSQDLHGRPLLSVCRDHRILEVLEESRETGEKSSAQIAHRSAAATSSQTRDQIWNVEAEPLTSSLNSKTIGAAWISIRDVTHELETDQIRRDFVANASHELRTPLSIINGYIETLSQGDIEANPQFAKRSLKTMEVHGERISRIVEDMLTISKLESFDELLKRKTFDLIHSAETMISHLQPLIEEQNAKVKIDSGTLEEWPLFGDRYYWDQIFFNLIDNALKQNQMASQLKVTVKLRKKEDRYFISICDNGVGIPAADLPLIFKRFYRVEKHHGKKVNGTGLGLSIVKRAVEAHGGTVSVESQPGALTSFHISVPITED